MENYFQMNFTVAQVNAISNLGLAHVGDGVYELLCRAYLCDSGDHTVLKLHRDAINLVKASTQAKFADRSRLLPAGFHVPRRTQDPTRVLQDFAYRACTFCG